MYLSDVLPDPFSGIIPAPSTYNCRVSTQASVSFHNISMAIYANVVLTMEELAVKTFWSETLAQVETQDLYLEQVY